MEPAEDAARRLLVERDLVRAAFGHLTTDAFLALPFEALGPTKVLLKRFFSPAPWGPDDDDALAGAVGPGEGRWTRDLDGDVALDYGWKDARFGVRATSTARPPGPGDATPPPPSTDPLAATFDGPVVPEATPNPRTIRFQVGAAPDGPGSPLGGPLGPSRWYSAAAAAGDDSGPARLFGRFPEVANVLVGSDFVAVGLHRAADWERLLQPVLAVVAEEFAPSGSDAPRGERRVTGGPAGAGAAGAGAAPAGAGADAHRVGRLEEAWRDLGSLRPAVAADLAEVRAAAAGDDPFRRQVAANLLREADHGSATAGWARLVADPARSVRRAAVDAMVDVDRPELRPLLEAALADADPWVRWKALRGLAQLGAGPSRAAVVAAAADPDFRVRLEAAPALRAAESDAQAAPATDVAAGGRTRSAGEE